MKINESLYCATVYSLVPPVLRANVQELPILIGKRSGTTFSAKSSSVQTMIKKRTLKNSDKEENFGVFLYSLL